MQTLKERIAGAYDALRKGAVVITSTLIVFVALKNSLIWHLEQFWGASKTFWSSLWAVAYRASGESHFLMFTFVTVTYAFIAYTVINIFFAHLDITGRPAFLLKYKVQEEKNVPVNWDRYKQTVRLVAFNLAVVNLICTVTTYPLVLWRGNQCGYELPAFTTTIWHLLVCIIMEEIGFYYIHRFLHNRYLYKRIHKVHHEWKAPVAVAALYAHPVEHYLTYLAMFLGPLITGAHLSVVWLWYTVGLWSITIAHSGYHLPFLQSTEAHDYHHLKFSQNYGTLGILDRLHGTDDLFRGTKAYERHILLLGLTPAKEIFPDAPKGKTGCHK